MNKILIVSEGPPPLGSTPAEGGALRAWGLAKGLAKNGHKVTLAYRSTFNVSADADKTIVPKNISLTVWDGSTLDTLIAEHKIIILRYAMGEALEFVKKLSDQHILVSDSYIPISIEVSARNSTNKDEHTNYLRLQDSCAKVSRRADYFLYASPAQRNYYIGYLSAINKINPTTYKQFNSRLFEVPYGVDSDDFPKDLTKLCYPKEPTLLWYGAFYSWFDMTSLIDSIKELKKEVPGFKLLIAGAKNPYNKDPSLLAHYNKTMQALGVLDNTIETIQWTPYHKRFEIYNRASAIITFNHLGLENELAWRTRLMDYTLSYKPIITNGLDPLGEDLINRGVAFRSSVQNMKDIFLNLYQNPPPKSVFDEVIDRYAWQNITREVSVVLESPKRLTSGKMVYGENQLLKKTKRAILLPIYFIRYIKKNGINRTIVRITGKQ